METLVYRVEFLDGAGFYRRGESNDFVQCDSRHPLPDDDFGLMGHWETLVSYGLNGSYFFGFDSIDTLKRWFNDHELQRMEGLFVIRVYKIEQRVYKRMSWDGEHVDIPSFVHGETQSIFLKFHAEHMYTLAPTEI